jgi:hypothetical protein
MTSLQGYITASYATLVEAFGEPTYGPEHSGDGKVSTEWDIDGISIYDWKECNDQVCRQGYYNWHIGGRSKQDVDMLVERMYLPGEWLSRNHFVLWDAIGEQQCG